MRQPKLISLAEAATGVVAIYVTGFAAMMGALLAPEALPMEYVSASFGGVMVLVLFLVRRGFQALEDRSAFRRIQHFREATKRLRRGTLWPEGAR